jgi:hypothetical protein
VKSWTVTLENFFVDVTAPRRAPCKLEVVPQELRINDASHCRERKLEDVELVGLHMTGEFGYSSAFGRIQAHFIRIMSTRVVRFLKICGIRVIRG